MRIALANLPFPATREESVTQVVEAIAEAAAQSASIICFPECFVPGYRIPGKPMPPPDEVFLEQAWATVASATAKANLTTILGTECPTNEGLLITALVIRADGTLAGCQNKVQIDPSEEKTYIDGGSGGREIFEAGTLTFGITICHEGWRYPETVRSSVRNGAQVVFHPHYHWAEPGAYCPTTFADPSNTFHEKAMLCRAAENTCYFASVNYASPGSPTTSAVVRPDGTLLCYQPYGKPGLLLADLDLTTATGLLADRYKPF